MTTFIITDLEATCDDNNKMPKHLSEIIEIGAVAVNQDLQVISEFQTFVKPVKTTILTDFCMQLTKIKQSDVDSAKVFEQAYYNFEEWFLQFNDPIFCSWGGYDFRALNRACNEIKIKFHFDKGTNLKHLFGKKQNNGKEVGLGKALNIAGLKFIGTPHRGIDDSKNIARLMPYSFYDEKISKKT